MGRFKELAPGLGITLSIVLIAFLASSLHVGFDPLVVSLIFGIFVVNILGDRRPLAAGVDAALRILLPVGIALYGSQLVIADGAGRNFVVTAFITTTSFGITYFVSRGFGLSRPNAVLLGTGLSVCGVAGMVLLAPLFGSRRDEVSVSVLSVLTVGLTGMLLFRFGSGLFGLGAEEFALLTGTTLPMLGQAKVLSVANPLGSATLQFMYVRMGMLAVLAVPALLLARRAGRPIGIPWFLVAFFVVAAVTNMSEWAASARDVLGLAGRAVLSAGLAAVGLSLEFDDMTSHGSSPLFAAYLAWGIVVLALYLVLNIMIG